MYTEEFLFPGTAGHHLSARIYCDNLENKNGVIFSHGLFSSMDGYKITRLAQNIVSSGYSLMTFNFSSAENFENNTRNLSVLQQVRELECAADEFIKRGIDRLHLMGSSMGSAITLLFASSVTISIQSLMLIATPFDLGAIIPGQIKDKLPGLDDHGYSEISGVMVNNSFLKEIIRISMIDTVKKINCPVLLIHGTDDDVVNFSNLALFTANCNTNCTELPIKGGDHNLTDNKYLNIISRNITEWLGKFNA